MQQEEQQSPITDTYLEDYEEFMEDDDRWRPQSGQAARTRKAAAARGQARF